MKRLNMVFASFCFAASGLSHADVTVSGDVRSPGQFNIQAGALALGAVALALQPLNTAIAEFARLYASEFQLVPLAPLPMAGLLAVSAGLGLIGAFLCVQRHLARLN